MCDPVVYILLGLVIGYVGGFAGIGGAPFMVAFLVLVCGMSQLFAQANVLSVMLGPMSLMGAYSLKDEIKPQIRHVIIGVLTYAVFSYFGASLAFWSGEGPLKTYFAFLLFGIVLIQVSPRFLKRFFKSPQKPEREFMPIGWLSIIGCLVGVLGGLFGIGAGVLMVPLFVSVFRMNKNNARALSLAILLPPVSIGGFLKYNSEGLVDINLVLILFFSYFVSNYFGAKLGSRVSTENFKIAYSVLLLLIGVIYLTLN